MSEKSNDQVRVSYCDLEFLLVNLGRNQVTAERLIRMFLENAPLLCSQLEKAARQGDLANIRDSLHDIRSSCVLFSGHLCVSQAREIEHFVREQLSGAVSSDQSMEWYSRCAPVIECVRCMVSELEAYLAERQG